MRFISTNDPKDAVTFEQAIFRSLPLGGGLYFPEKIPSPFNEETILKRSLHEIYLEISQAFIGEEIPKSELEGIISETLSFPLPLIEVEPRIHSLELFHGPTWAFKDVGARFLSRCMGFFSKKRGEQVTILVATSGDTGGAVAAGFHGVKGVEVKILFPKGKVSGVQKQQLTTWGDNIAAFEVDGTFDDCQRLVKKAFLDRDLNESYNLSSANSINIARLIPQSFYYFNALKELGAMQDVVISVPSGNFGNLTAGLMAWKMGLPVKRFIAATNINKVVPDYLTSGNYVPKASMETYANAMDVGDPSNFVRLSRIFGDQHDAVVKMISGFFMTDDQIVETMKSCFQQNDYLLDPHGAIGYQALKTQLNNEENGIFLETAHPVKFPDVVNQKVDLDVKYQGKINEFTRRETNYQTIPNDFSVFKDTLSTTSS